MRIQSDPGVNLDPSTAVTNAPRSELQRLDSVAPIPASGAPVERQFDHYKLFVENYQQQFDLMARCMALYVAVVGTVIGFAFAPNAPDDRSIALATFVGMLSGLALVTHRPLARLLRAHGQTMAEYERTLFLKTFPVGGASTLLSAFSIFNVLILAGSLGLILRLI